MTSLRSILHITNFSQKAFLSQVVKQYGTAVMNLSLINIISQALIPSIKLPLKCIKTSTPLIFQKCVL